MDRGQAGNFLFTLQDFHGLKTQITAADTVFPPHGKGRGPEITAALAGIFHRQGVCGNGAVHARFVGVSGEASVHKGKAVAHITFRSGTVVSMHQHITWTDLHLVGGMVGMERNSLIPGIMDNGHRRIPHILGVYL